MGVDVMILPKLAAEEDPGKYGLYVTPEFSLYNFVFYQYIILTAFLYCFFMETS